MRLAWSGMQSVDSVDPLAAAIAGSSRFGALVLDACSRVDRFVLEHFIRRPAVAPPRGLRARLARAAAFYGDERFIAEPESFFVPPGPLRPVDARPLVWLPGGELVELSYETDFEPVFPEARAVDAASRRGVALWWRHGRAGRPAVVCVHGYGGGTPWIESLAFEAAAFYRDGTDVLLYVLPCHGPRTPPGARHSGEAFFDMDLVRTTEAFARAIYEIRALTRHVEARGVSAVGAFGMSLGAYTVALLATVERRLAFAAAMIPVVSFADRWWAEGAADPWLATAIAHGWTADVVREITRVHEPLARPPLLRPERLLVIGALGDGICTPAHAEMLWRHWGRPRIHWYRGGHLVQLGRREALRAVRDLARGAMVHAAAPEPAAEGRRPARRRA